MRLIRFIAKHWIISIIVVTIVFGIALPKLEAELISMVGNLVNTLLGGK